MLLIYEDDKMILESMNKKFFLFIYWFIYTYCNEWSSNVDKNKKDLFIDITANLKFALAPRGYDRSSFRFFEIFKLVAIPIYVWDDIDWLPYKDIIDYSKFCISINIKDINNLENILDNIDETKYNLMISEYNKHKHFFELQFMCNYIAKL